MNQKTTGAILITLGTVIVLLMIFTTPFHYSSITHGKITRTSYSIIINEGAVTRVNLIFTIVHTQVTTNGYVEIATIHDSTATYTIENIVNNTASTTVFTAIHTKPPQFFVITYNNGYLTYNDLTYYTNTNNPIVFGSSTTNYYNLTFVVHINNATVNWQKTSIK